MKAIGTATPVKAPAVALARVEPVVAIGVQFVLACFVARSAGKDLLSLKSARRTILLQP